MENKATGTMIESRAFIISMSEVLGLDEKKVTRIQLDAGVSHAFTAKAEFIIDGIEKEKAENIIKSFIADGE